MKAVAVTPGIKTVGIVDQPEPRIASPTDVKLRMIEAGVCGTDKEICAFEYGTPSGWNNSLSADPSVKLRSRAK
jgi:threonine dehydrogenase-like Zn-dependent dehydrogenase